MSFLSTSSISFGIKVSPSAQSELELEQRPKRSFISLLCTACLFRERKFRYSCRRKEKLDDLSGKSSINSQSTVRNLKVLVVDDSVDGIFRDQLVFDLCENGFAVDVSENSSVALEKIIDRTTYDIIVTVEIVI